MDNPNHCNTIGEIFNGLVAFGTILLALLAIYGERVKRFLFKPKLKISVNSISPFIESIQDINSEDASIVQNTSSIKIKIENTGKTTALKCQGFVEKVWRKHKSNENYYELVTVTPSQLDWHNNLKVFDISPHIPAYIEIARIQYTEIRTEATSTHPSENSSSNAELYLSVVERGKKGVYIKLGKGTFIIPFILYSDNLGKTLKFYIEIFWDGDNATRLFESNFYIKKIKENELNAEILNKEIKK